MDHGPRVVPGWTDVPRRSLDPRARAFRSPRAGTARSDATVLESPPQDRGTAHSRAYQRARRAAAGTPYWQARARPRSPRRQPPHAERRRGLLGARGARRGRRGAADLDLEPTPRP